MKKAKILMMVAMGSTAISPIVSTAVYADTIPTVIADAADGVTLDAMQSQCAALAMARDIDGPGGDNWSSEVVEGAVTLVSGPTLDESTKVIDESTIVGTGTFTPGVTYIDGDPFRIGGSVNMFGNQYATSGRWSNSTYYYTGDFNSKFAHAFSCNIIFEDYHEAVNVPAEGEYVVNGDFGESEGAIRGNCAAFTAQGFPIETRPDWWGVEIFRGGSDRDPHCRFEGTGPRVEPEYYDPEVIVDTVAGIPVEQDQTDTLTAFEDSGGPVNAEGGPFYIGQTVICISPSKTVKGGVPGAWQKHNGYTGVKCDTNWFQSTGIYLGAGAVWGAGTPYSNGTYISVPNYTY